VARAWLTPEEAELADVERQMEEQLVAQHRLADRVIAQRAEPDGSLRYLAKARARRRQKQAPERQRSARSRAAQRKAAPRACCRRRVAVSLPGIAGGLGRAGRAASLGPPPVPAVGALLAPVQARPRLAGSPAPAWRPQAGRRGFRTRLLNPRPALLGGR